MPAFVLRLIAPRPEFAMTLTDAEREIMGAHAAHWQPYVQDGSMAVFGPVLDGTCSGGVGVLEADDEDTVRAHADADPAVVSGTARLEFGRMLAGFVRPSA